MKYAPVKAAAALTLAGGTAFAGGMAEPVAVMPVEIVEDATESRSSSAGLLIPLIVIAALVAISQSGSDDSSTMVTQITPTTQ